MGRSSKRKGSHYEREFVARCDDHAGLFAERVPLSGAMGGSYTEDVVVANCWRIECKYRQDGTGFKRLYDWIAGNDLLVIEGEGVQLRVYTLEAWCAGCVAHLDREEPTYSPFTFRESTSSFGTLTGWIGDADYLAVRMPRSPWLVIDIDIVGDDNGDS